MSRATHDPSTPAFPARHVARRPPSRSGARAASPLPLVARRAWWLLILAAAGCHRWPLDALDGRAIQAVVGQAALRAPAPAAARPGDDPGPQRASFRSREAAARIAALDAWIQTRQEPLPADALRLASDPNSSVRAAAVRAIARRPPADAEPRIAAALADYDVEVRLAAVAALATIGGDASRARLERLKDDPGDLVRAAAVGALGRLGADDVVFDALTDKSWRVRKEVAAALARRPSRRAASAAADLLDDPSAEVQLQVIESISGWPLRLGGPVLLEAMGKTCRATRKTAADRLAAQWPAAAEFPCDAPAHGRAPVLDVLRDRFRREFGSVDADALARAAERKGEPGVSRDRLDAARDLVRQLSDPSLPPQARGEALARLRAFGPELAAALDELALREKQELPEAVWRDVLAAGDPAFAAIEQLRSPNVTARRRAAERLARLASKQPLERLAVARLAAVCAAEPDASVLQSVLVAVAGDPSEEACALACAAISHPSHEVRRAACEHLGAHPRPEHAEVLRPALDDSHPTVVVAAIRALAAGGRLDDPEMLRRFLRSPSESLVLEAAAALAQLGDASGTAALERSAASHDAAIRRQAAAAMGRIGDPSFAPALVRLLDDQQGIRVAALQSLPKVTGLAPPQGECGEASADRQADWWKGTIAPPPNPFESEPRWRSGLPATGGPPR